MFPSTGLHIVTGLVEELESPTHVYSPPEIRRKIISFKNIPHYSTLD